MGLWPGSGGRWGEALGLLAVLCWKSKTMQTFSWLWHLWFSPGLAKVFAAHAPFDFADRSDRPTGRPTSMLTVQSFQAIRLVFGFIWLMSWPGHCWVRMGGPLHSWRHVHSLKFVHISKYFAAGWKGFFQWNGWMIGLRGQQQQQHHNKGASCVLVPVLGPRWCHLSGLIQFMLLAKLLWKNLKVFALK